MTKRIINQVQDFLTVISGDGNRIYQIVNIQLLLRRHPPEAVVSFLKELQKDYGKQLRKMLSENRSDPLINEIVVKRFRVRMAINTIRTAEDEQRMLKKIIQVWDGINKGVFVPNDTSWKCNNCSYKNACDDWFKG